MSERRENVRRLRKCAGAEMCWPCEGVRIHSECDEFPFKGLKT